MFSDSKTNDTQRGNVLFLILIAVALFAALSYSVTQSMRGGGDAGDETTRINITPLINYAVSVRSSVLKMLIEGSDINLLEFNPPAEFANCTAGFRRCVFHPSGGQGTHTEGNPDAMNNGLPGEWVFNGANEINNLGTSNGVDASSPATADLIAFLPGIKQEVCLKINQEQNINLIPIEAGIEFSSASGMVNPNGATDTSITGAGATLGLPTGTNVDQLDGKAYGCFEQGGAYVFFHSLIER